MKKILLSLKTTIWTLLALIFFFFVGSYMMPAHRGVFSTMNDDILLAWMKNRAAENVDTTWWFFAALAGLVLLTLNTAACGIEAVKGRWRRPDVLLRIAPQVIHAGFLCILLAHLIGAGWGYRVAGTVPEGVYARLPGNRTLLMKDIRMQQGPSGYMTDYSADALIYEHGVLVKTGTLGPNEPVFYDGMGVYLKQLSFEPGPAAYLIVARDPGAVWALIGGVLFIVGSTVLLALKWRKPRLVPETPGYGEYQ